MSASYAGVDGTMDLQDRISVAIDTGIALSREAVLEEVSETIATLHEEITGLRAEVATLRQLMLGR